MTTCVILAKNSARTIPRAMANAEHVFKRVLVLDSGSVDSTLDLVRENPSAELFELEWGHSFAEIRNSAMDLVGDGLLFFLDSDEWIPEDSLNSVHRELGKLPEDPCLAWSPVVKDAETGYEVRNLPRILWANGQLQYRYRVHEQLVHGKQRVYPKTLDIDVLHSGYTEMEMVKHQKIDRNLSLLEMDISERPEDPHPLFYWMRDGMGRRSVDESFTLVEQIDALSSASFSTEHSAEPYPLLARKVLLTDAWLQDGASELTLKLADGILALEPNDPDGRFVHGMSRLGQVHEQLGELLANLAKYRQDIDGMPFSWGMSTRPDHLDALIGELMRELGHWGYKEYLASTSSGWTDKYFIEATLRGSQ